MLYSIKVKISDHIIDRLMQFYGTLTNNKFALALTPLSVSVCLVHKYMHTKVKCFSITDYNSRLIIAHNA